MKTNENPPLAIGSPVWVFDQNHRIYPKGSGCGAGPIYREYWRKHLITAETDRSWILAHCLPKIPKSGRYIPGVCRSEQEVDDDCWREDHKHKLSRLVEKATPQQLRRVAEILNYQP